MGLIKLKDETNTWVITDDVLQRGMVALDSLPYKMQVMLARTAIEMAEAEAEKNKVVQFPNIK